MRVEVYWNIRKRVFSIRAAEGEFKGLVVGHATAVEMRDVSFVVQPAGRERARREGQKNVHAFLRGELYNGFEWYLYDEADLSHVTYNPFRDEHFTVRGEVPGTEIHWAANVMMRVENGKPIILADAALMREPYAA